MVHLESLLWIGSRLDGSIEWTGGRLPPIQIKYTMPLGLNQLNVQKLISCEISQLALA